MNSYPCKIVEWLDGDTADVDVMLEFLGTRISLRQRVRVDGINAPEIHSTNPDEKRLGLLSQVQAKTLAPIGLTVNITTANPAKPREKYGRWLGKVTLHDGSDFAAKMIAGGFAKEYHGEKR